MDTKTSTTDEPCPKCKSKDVEKTTEDHCVCRACNFYWNPYFVNEWIK